MSTTIIFFSTGHSERRLDASSGHLRYCNQNNAALGGSQVINNFLLQSQISLLISLRDQWSEVNESACMSVANCIQLQQKRQIWAGQLSFACRPVRFINTDSLFLRASKWVRSEEYVADLEVSKLFPNQLNACRPQANVIFAWVRTCLFSIDKQLLKPSMVSYSASAGAHTYCPPVASQASGSHLVIPVTSTSGPCARGRLVFKAAL